MRGPILELKADAGRAIAVTGGVYGDACREVEVWQPAPGTDTLVVGPRRDCAYGYVSEIALAGDRAAWVEGFGNNVWNSSMHVLSLAGGGRNITVESAAAEGQGGGQGTWVDDPRGDGALLVYNSYRHCTDWAMPPDKCPAGVSDADINERVVMVTQQGAAHPIAASARTVTVLAVGGGRVVARLTSGELIVLAPKQTPTPLVSHEGFRAERLIAAYPYKPGQVGAAATDGRTLAVLRTGMLDVIPMTNSRAKRTTWTLPHARSYSSDSPIACEHESGCSATALRLTDLDGNLALYIFGNDVYLLDLTSGRSVVIAQPKATRVDAQLEPDGLYVAADNTLTFTPRAQVEQRLHR